jgi:hypothetical protein
MTHRLWRPDIVSGVDMSNVIHLKRCYQLFRMILVAGFLIMHFGQAAIELRSPLSLSTIAADTGRRPTSKKDGTDGTVLIAAGDIGDCDGHGDEATAKLVKTLKGTIVTLGDDAYPSGSKQDYSRCFGRSWGSVKRRIHPTPGNHDYDTSGASGYFDYFGSAAGDRDKGFYSYDLGAWHIIVLNSNCGAVGGCDANSEQGQWLSEDLQNHHTTCILAYWHHPLYSSGTEHGGDPATRPLWQALYDEGADVVLSGHEHNYERFSPQDAAGKIDRKRGIRAFVVGSGGAGHYPLGRPLRTSEVRNDTAYGVLELTLRETGYDWRFIAAGSRAGHEQGNGFTDSGSARCH